ncbi:Myotubularin-related protein 7 [Liparis tanakae]|uniref:Myotubularin-related protein 7 n=1 Tax=Liparis tanakae TaxID=230148 RepID=A0A4Z2GG35_9TELE|nr:Myotubularin-related protein 7 [Liparis tanakae]
MEHIRLPKVENVRLLDRVSPRRSRVGTLYLTATHTIFVENEAGVRNETWVSISETTGPDIRVEDVVR